MFGVSPYCVALCRRSRQKHEYNFNIMTEYSHSVFIFEHKPITSNVALATKEQNGCCLTWEIISKK